MALLDYLFGGDSPVSDPSEMFYAPKGRDNKAIMRPFSFEQPSGIFGGLVDPRNAPNMDESPKRKRQTQGSSLPEAVAQIVKEQFRGPGGMKSPPQPEYADEPPKEEFKGFRAPGGIPNMEEPQPEQEPEQPSGGGLLGALKKFGPDIGGEVMDLYDKSITPDTMRLGIMMKRAGLIENIKDVAIAPHGLKEEFKQGILKNAFRDSVNEKGDFDEPKLIKNLSNAGFGKEAYDLWNRRMTESKKLAVELEKIDAKKKEPGVQLTDEKLEDIRRKFPNAKIELNGDGSIKKITQDPNATRAQNLRERKEEYQQQKQEFVEGIPRLPGSGGPIQAPGQQRPQVGQAPGRIQPGPGGAMDAGGRFPAAQMGGEPGAIVANPRDWNFSQRFTPALNPMTRPKTTSQAIKREQEIKKELKEEFGKTPIRDETANRDKLNRIQRSVGKVEGENLLPNVDTGQYKGIVGEYMRNPEFEELRAQFRRLSFENIPKGMSRLFDSEAERKMYEEAQPAMTNNPKTNWNIIQHMRSDLDRSMEYRRFKTAYGLKNQTTEGADEAWTEYTSNNPAVVNNTKGVAVENGLSLSPKDYFTQDMQGAKPLPIDWNEVNKKYKNVNQPIVNVPDSTISKLKDDETYMFPGGSRTGAQLKAMKKRVNERGGK